MWKLIIFIFISGPISGQVNICGNTTDLCLPIKTDEIHSASTYNSSDLIMVFATAESIFSNEQIDSIVSYVYEGKNLYIGADNWPLQAESNLITKRMFNETFYGNFANEEAELSRNESLIDWNKEDLIPAGNTTSAFPLKAGFTVEAWISDQPLILAGRYGKGRVIIDGGYSRFYCQHKCENCEKLFITFLEYLLNM